MIISLSKNCNTNLLCLFYLHTCFFFSFCDFRQEKASGSWGIHRNFHMYNKGRFDHFNRRNSAIIYLNRRIKI